MGERGRKRTAAALAVVACLVAPIAMVALWADRNLFDTPRFTSRVVPAIDDPEVQAAVSTYLTEQVLTVVDVDGLLENAFEDRPRAQVLVGPISAAVESLIARGVVEVVDSEQFAALWGGAIEVAHTAAMRVLRDESRVLDAAEAARSGEVTLDLHPIVEAVMARVADVAPDLIPAGSEIPAFDDLGQVVVFDQDRITTAQQALERFERFVWLAVVVALACMIGAVLVAVDRRRTVLQLVAGLIIGDVLVRRAGIRAVEEVRSITSESGAPAAAGAVLDRFLDPLLTFTAWAIVVLLLTGAIVALTGPYSWAVRSRDHLATTWAWLDVHRGVAGGAIAVLGLALLWAFDLDWWAILLFIALVAAAVLWSTKETSEPTTASA
jgi:heme exporter protein D